MKIAVTYDNGQIFQHFGHSAQFKLYEVSGGMILNTAVVDTNGSGHGALAGFLKQNGVDTLICGGIGGGAINALAQAGITVYAGAQGSCDACVEALIAGTLAQNGEATCDCHGHDQADDAELPRRVWLPALPGARGEKRRQGPLRPYDRLGRTARRGDPRREQSERITRKERKR